MILTSRISPILDRRSKAMLLLPCLLVFFAWMSADLLAQTAPAAPPDQSSRSQATPDPFSNLGLPGEEGGCAPPSTQEKIMIGVGTGTIMLVLFFLLVRLMERRYIQQDRSATLGRHVGFSLTLFLSAGGFLALVYLVTGCIHPSIWLWLAFWGGILVIHILYTIIAVRGH